MIGAVALAASLIVAVSTAGYSVQQSMESRLLETLGAADARIIHLFQGRFDDDLLDEVRRWPEVRQAAGRFSAAITLIRKDEKLDPETGLPLRITPLTHGIDPALEFLVRPIELSAGRFPAARNEIVIDSFVADRLEAGPGDVLVVQRFGEPIELTVVGAYERDTLGTLQRPQALMLRDDVEEAAERYDTLTDIAIMLRDGEDVNAFCARYIDRLPEQLQLEPAELARTGFDRRVRATRIVFTISALWAFLSCSFIIVIGMTTGVTERLRELAIVRSIGASRAQVFLSQLWIGVVVGALGAIVGIPIGIALAAGLIWHFRELVPSGLEVGMLGIVLAVIGSIGAGLAGAVWPAFEASRVSPLRAIAVRAQPFRPRSVVWFAVLGIGAITAQIALYQVPDLDTRFWVYAIAGLPLMQIGYFLLAVPVLYLIVRLLGRLLSRLLRLPRDLLPQSVLAIPYRLGLTAGALMIGVAILIGSWTSTTSVMRDWLGRMTFADGFAFRRNGITRAERDLIAQLPFVTGTAPIGYIPLRVKGEQVFGVQGLAPPNITCIGFEPEGFFEINRIQWVAGSPEEAVPRLKRGDAVLVAKEFLTTRGVKLGDTLTLGAGRIWHDYEIVGVVEAAGLDVATQMFGIRNAYNEHAIRCVFADFDVMAERFDNPDVYLLQINLSNEISDDEARIEISRAVPGVLFVSGRSIKEGMNKIGRAVLVVQITIAFAALLLACVAVGNVLIANVVARQFEYGMLRAVGASRGHLVRLVLGEAALLAAAAMVVGSLFGYHTALIDIDMYRTLGGLELSPRVPLGVGSIAWLVLLAMTLLAALPAALWLIRRTPRELFAVGRGGG